MRAKKTVLVGRSTADSKLIYDFLGSARVFAKAVRDVIEKDVLREVTGNKLTMAHLKLLFFVAKIYRATVGEAAEFLGVSRPAASKTVEKLVRRKLLLRKGIRNDRRSSVLSLTEVGRHLLVEYETARNKRASDIFSQYEPEVIQNTSEMLDRLASGIAGRRDVTKNDDVCLQCEIYFRKDCRFGKYGSRKCYYLQHRKNKMSRIKE